MLGSVACGVVVLVIAVYLAYAAYIKIAHPFWSRLPMHHSYNALNRFRAVGVITDKPAERSKWTNDVNIRTVRCDRLPKERQESIVRFLGENTTTHDSVSYKPTVKSVFAHYNAHNRPAFVSIYYEKHHDLHKDENANLMVGVIMSRPLSVQVRGERFVTYLMENMVLGKDQARNADEIAPELIHTTIHRQQTLQENRTCMFVRRGRLGIPVETLISYKVFFFQTLDWGDRRSLPAHYQVKSIDTKSMFTIRDVLQNRMRERFKCVVMPAWDNISELVTTKNLFIYTLSNNDDMLAVYFFKDTATAQSGGRVIECVGAANLCGNTDLFAAGFSDALLDVRQSYDNVLVHGLADSATLVDAIQVKHRARDVTDHHVFFYNYIHPRVAEKECLMIY